MNKWIYDIFLNSRLVFDSCEDIFDTEQEAIEDAEYCINDYLANQHGAEPSDFQICTYCAVL